MAPVVYGVHIDASIRPKMNIRTDIHTYMYIYIHIHTHIHMQARRNWLYEPPKSQQFWPVLEMICCMGAVVVRPDMGTIHACLKPPSFANIPQLSRRLSSTHAHHFHRMVSGGCVEARQITIQGGFLHEFSATLEFVGGISLSGAADGFQGLAPLTQN